MRSGVRPPTDLSARLGYAVVTAAPLVAGTEDSIDGIVDSEMWNRKNENVPPISAAPFIARTEDIIDGSADDSERLH